MKQIRGQFRPRVESLESRICMSFGGLDPAFGNAGVVQFENLQTVDSLDEVHGIVALSDDSLVVSGTSEVGSGPVLAFAKLDDQGAPDATFGTNGLVTLPFELARPTVIASSSGNLYVGGNRFTEGALEYLVLKINANGSLDGTFAGIGYRAFTADAKMVAVGSGIAVLSRQDSPSLQYQITMLTGAGAIDETFGTLGFSDLIGLPGDGSVAPQFVRDDQGHFYVATQQTNGSTSLYLTRLTAAGATDLTFGAGGVLADSVPIGTDWTLAAEQGTGGTTLVVWQVSDDLETTVLARRVLANGTADTSFGTAGLLTRQQLPGAFNAEYERSPLLVSTGPGEMTVVLSIEDFFREFRFYSLVIGPNGQWDSAHGDSGIGVSGEHEFRHLDAVTPVAVSDGDLRIAAWGYDTSAQPIVDWRIFGLDADGNTDTAFGAGGLASVDFTAPSSYVDTFDIALTQSSIAVVQSPRIQEAVVVRPSLGQGLLSVIYRDGDPNAGHPSGGSFSLGATVEDDSFAWTVTRDGGFVLAGVSEDANQGGFAAVLTLQKRLPNGSVDPNFGGGGQVTIPTQLAAPSLRPLLRPGNDGSLYVLVSTTDDTQPGWIAKVSSTGQLLTSFDNDGMLRFAANTERVVDASTSSSRIHLLVSDSATSTSQIKIQALGNTGAVVTSFGDQGTYTADLPDGSQLVRLVQDGAGRLLVLYRTDLQLRLHRVTSSGQLDAGFGLGGEVLISNLVQTEGTHADVELLGDEPFVAATTGLFGENTLVVKLQEDGSPDTSFGQGGTTTLNLSEFGERVRDVKVLPDASVLVGVRTLDAMSSYGVVAKLEGQSPSPVPLHNVYRPLNTSRPDDQILSGARCAAGDLLLESSQRARTRRRPG